jgi:hypothetical protein
MLRRPASSCSQLRLDTKPRAYDRGFGLCREPVAIPKVPAPPLLSQRIDHPLRGGDDLGNVRERASRISPDFPASDFGLFPRLAARAAAAVAVGA